MPTATISGKRDPVVRAVTRNDVVEALGEGLRDFQRAPLYGLVIGGGCALVGSAIIATLYAIDMPYFAYPIAAGFAIVAPLVAAALYEVSRRLERGLPLGFLDVVKTVVGRREIRWMGFMTLFVLIAWMYQVRLLLAIFLGFSAMSANLGEFISTVLTTNEGLMFLAIGNVIGAALALALFSLSVVSFPLLLDREVDFVTAIITSIKAVVSQPGPMLFFAAIILLLLLVSALPFFIGLIVTLPVLGHATWHLFRRVVAPEAGE